MKDSMSVSEYKKFSKKMNKYRAVKTIRNGITFHSKAEANRYSELLLLQKSGEIQGLKRQTKFYLRAWSPTDSAGSVIGFYKSDFDYADKNKGVVIEDVKGISPSTYRLKKKIFEANYGIKITEITRRKHDRRRIFEAGK